MTWVEKSQHLSVEDLPIQGLHLLDGDVILAFLQLKYGAVETPLFNPARLQAQKRPQVEFPSGLTLDVEERTQAEHGVVIHLFGEMDLPYFDTREHAWQEANEIAECVGYFATRRGTNQLEVIGHDEGEHFLITYDNQERHIADITQVKREERKQSSEERDPLLDQASRERLPKLYANEAIGLNAVAQVKFFSPSSNWTWYASEASVAMNDGTYRALTEVDSNDPNIEDVIFFGLVDGFELELGYFSLSELESSGGGLQLPIERDRHFTPTTLKALQAKHNQ